MTEDNNTSPAKPSDAAQNSGIFAKLTVPRHLNIIGDQRFNVINKMRTVRMARHLCTFPRVQIDIKIGQGTIGFFTQLTNFRAHTGGTASFGGYRQFINFFLEFSNGFFEIEKYRTVNHGRGLGRCH